MSRRLAHTLYGAPRPPPSRLAAFCRHALTALRDPTQADDVAAVGELTGLLTLQRLSQTLQEHPVGRQILQDKPLVTQATVEPLLQDCPPDSFGAAYSAFLDHHGFDPDERSPNVYLDSDSDESYVLLRYRQSHDFAHVLTGLPPTVLGELALKWLELVQTGLPLAALSGTVGSLRLGVEEQRRLWKECVPWALQHRHLPYGSLLCVYYERQFHTPLGELRKRLGVVPAPDLPRE